MTFTWVSAGHLARAGLLWGLLGLSLAAEAADPRYLNQLKAEATETNVDEVPAEAAAPARPAASKSATKPTGQKGYLQGLEAEAGHTQIDDSGQVEVRELDSNKQPKPRKTRWDIKTQSLDSLRPGLAREQFEAVLKDNYYASFVFYKKLDPTSKTLVYKTYQKDPSIQVVRNQIISLSK